MINSLWISQTGMEAQQLQLDVIANNLANMSTNGFKKSQAVFQELMYVNLRQVGSATSEQNILPTGLQIGLGVRPVGTSRSFTSGTMQQTNNQFDISIQGHGFFQVTMPDGTIGYTRDGAFQVDNQGRLVNASGLPIVGDITVPSNAVSISIASNGTVTATIQGTVAPQQIGTITLASFINPPGLEPRGENVYTETAASGAPNVSTAGTNGLGTLAQGFLEASNVNAVQELVSMIQTQRAYELNSKAIQTADQMLQKLGQL